ncbi:MAG: HNH endonuclease [Gemmatimonadota bacterium]|jgi:5-methylcytosine-specific restriction endonuclease McrA|nr:HNH endonuclease [Gemmatimonadota bacterium]
MMTPFRGRNQPEESLRARILRRDGFRCVYCGSIHPDEELTLDHVQPRARGGDGSDGNLVTACQACNTLKASHPAWAFLADRPEQRENFLRYGTAVWERHRRAVVEAASRRDGSTR